MSRLDALPEPARVELLVADDDPRVRSLVAAAARDRLAHLSVAEAADGAEAVQLALQRRPQVALLAVDLPRLRGVEAALTLRSLVPHLDVALHSPRPSAHRDEARAHRLLLFDELHLGGAIAWLEARVLAGADPDVVARPLQKLSLECSVCGYGVVRATPPERCVMCASQDAWTHAPWRPFVHGNVGAR